MWKKRQEQPRRNVTFGKVTDWNLRLFSMFFKFNKWYQIAQSASYAKSFNHKHELLGYLNFVYVHHFFKVKRRISEILAGLIWFNCFEMALVWTKNKRKAKAPYFSQIKTLCARKILPCYARDKIFCLGLLSYRQFLVRKVYTYMYIYIYLLIYMHIDLLIYAYLYICILCKVTWFSRSKVFRFARINTQKENTHRHTTKSNEINQ